MKFYQPHDEDLQINLTPLIDVVFLLLIFFMVSTTFDKESELQIRLPEATAVEKPAQELRYLEILISQSGQISVKGPNEESAKVLLNNDSDTLQRALGKVAAQPESLVVVIRADKSTTHEMVIRAMDAARRLELLQVTFATLNRSE
ncbi:MAG: biopolymer transport protein ExbD [Parasphingorhabdus sp.]|jgi:biopolymer transport protein ExbD